MNINILSQDKTTLVNYRNVVEISIRSKYKDFDTKELQWEIIAYYSAVSSHNVLNTILGKYDTEVRCLKEFEVLTDKIKRDVGFIYMA